MSERSELVAVFRLMCPFTAPGSCKPGITDGHKYTTSTTETIEELCKTGIRLVLHYHANLLMDITISCHIWFGAWV
jgi:hypothetical protein